MAGKVIESVTGKNFFDYMDTPIFQPLGMTRSSFREYPGQSLDGYLDPELEKNRAIGYRWAGGRFVPYDQFFQHRGMYPAGSVSSTATDMAIYMLAHLNGGAIDGKRILAVDTVDQMHTLLRSKPMVLRAMPMDSGVGRFGATRRLSMVEPYLVSYQTWCCYLS